MDIVNSVKTFSEVTLSSLDPALPGSAGLLDESLSFQQALNSGSKSSAAYNHTTELQHLIFIDSAIENSNQLRGGIQDTNVVMLDANRDGVEQIASVLSQHNNLASVHILSHGSAGKLQLGNTYLNADTLHIYTNQLQSWGNALNENADMLFYGCQVGAGADGLNFVQQVSSLTEADVQASDDITGSATKGGNWDLEIATGSIEADLAVDATTRDAYDGVFAPTTTTFNDFSSLSGLTLNGNASQVGKVLRLTPASASQHGSAFLNNSIAIAPDTSFQTHFQFQASGGQGSGGADGFTFMLQNTSAGVKALGGTGGGLGYSNSGTGSIAIEFDTHQNASDTNGNHISLLRDGNEVQALATQAVPVGLNSGSPINAWIDYSGSTNRLDVYISNIAAKPTSATLTQTIDLAAIVGSKAFAGFSAATGGAWNNHDIQNWQLTVVPPTQFGIFELETNTISVNENGGNTTVAVLRQQGSEGQVKINYSMYAGSATPTTDYATQSGTLVFNPGETRKTVTIPIVNDTLKEGNEDFGFVIDNPPGGAALGSQRTATVRIIDDESNTTATFNDFSSLSGLTLNGNASQAGKVLRLTPASGTQHGSAFFNTPVTFDTNTSFQTQFQFQISGGQGSGGADGLTFMLQNTAAGVKALGGTGGGLGYQSSIGTPTQPSFAIEFDTYKNTWESSGNHVSLLKDGNVMQAIATKDAPIDLNSGSPINAWFNYNGSTDRLDIYLSNTTVKPAQSLISQTIDLAAIVGSKAFAGFSAATGGLGNNHDIQNWQFSTTVPPTPPTPTPGTGSNLKGETVISGLLQPTAIDWIPNTSKMLVSEKGGVVRIYENGKLLSTPFIDISKQVNNTGDRGLLDIAVHPNFAQNPYVYLLHTYDPPEVYQNTGLAGPDGKGNRAGRLTRVTADPKTNYTTAIAGSETILLGKNSTWKNFNGFVDSTVNFAEPPAAGIKLQDFLAADSLSHSVGTAEFGPDGALYVSNGDGTSYNQVDQRTVRVQDVNNLSGKILRIDPITGEGLPDNPFYNGDSKANRSKVYQYGLRNPFRFTIDPNSPDPRKPKVYIGDVGWRQWEEINSAGSGANFGWPYYEGGNGTSLKTSNYQDLKEAKDFYASGKPVTAPILALNHAIDGINAIVTGDVYRGTAYPDKYRGDLFFIDLGKGIVRNANLDASGKVTSVEIFTTGANYVVQSATGPDSLMYYVDLDNGTVGRWRFV